MERTREQSLERINTFSNGIFAIIITIMVLDLKRPESATFAALGRLWPVWVSYIASYSFIAIIWGSIGTLILGPATAGPAFWHPGLGLGHRLWLFPAIS